MMATLMMAPWYAVDYDETMNEFIQCGVIWQPYTPFSLMAGMFLIDFSFDL